MGMVRSLNFDGELLKRGFWLYVWEISTPVKTNVYYVGRTGDSSSNNAQSPFNRMGQHLGFNKNSNVLRRRLEGKGIIPEKCEFRLVAYGPILKEETTPGEHVRARNTTAALEKALADALAQSGYEVLNTVNCRKKLDLNLWDKVRKELAVHFPRLDEGIT
ncbi:hypothetical protein ACFLWZ_07160 [Chloroflexota bacterium]